MLAANCNYILTPRKRPPESIWQVAVPKYLIEVMKAKRVLMTLDVHAVAYASYLENVNLEASEETRYRMSYVLAWMYATYPDTFEMLYPHRIKETKRVLGSGEIKTRLAYSGDNMTPGLFACLDEDEYEDDEELELRIGPHAKMTKAAEKALNAENPDTAMTAAYLRAGQEADFKFFIRRSFVDEEFSNNAQLAAITIYNAVNDSSFTIDANLNVPRSIKLSMEEYRFMFLTEVHQLSPRPEENKIPKELVTPILELAANANIDEILHSPMKYETCLASTSVSFIKLGIKVKLLERMNSRFWEDLFNKLDSTDLDELDDPGGMQQMVNQPVQIIVFQDATGIAYAHKLKSPEQIMLWERLKKTCTNEEMRRRSPRITIAGLFGSMDDNIGA